MSFGFGVGDFIAVGELAKRLYEDIDARHEAKELHALQNELWTLSMSMELLIEKFSGPDSTLAVGEEELDPFNRIVTETKKILQDLEKFIQRSGLGQRQEGGPGKTKSMANKRQWAKVRWAFELPRVRDLCTRLQYRNESLKLLLMFLRNPSQQEIEAEHHRKMADNLADIKKMMEQLTQAQLTHKAPDNRKIRLLCLDGGGVKGVSSLRMLQEIMDEVDRLERLKESEGESTDENSHGRQNEPRPPLKPCQYFDLICGTSTGGLIALMLGRLEYTVEDAIKEYHKLGERIFKKKLPWLTRWDATYDHKNLEDCLQEVIQNSQIEPKLGKDAPFKDSSRRCKTFVITTTLLENSPRPALLRSYDTESFEPYYAFPGTIWEAGRATSAAPTFFKPLVFENQTYSDGATIANNPSYEGIIEACRIWDPSSIDCIVSLGTGPEGEHTIENAPLEIMPRWAVWLCKKVLSRSIFYRLQLAFYSLQAMTGTERAHHNTTAMVETFRRSNYISAAEKDKQTPLDKVYFRLNVTDGNAKVGLDAWKEMKNLEDLAEAYINNNSGKDPVAASDKEAIAKVLAQTTKEAPHRPPMKGPPPEDYDDLWEPKFLFILPGPSPEYHQAKCLLDTGAENNFVAADFVHRWKIPEEPLRPKNIAAFEDISGNLIKPVSMITLQFTLGSRSEVFTNEFLILDTLAVDVVIGNKFIFGNNMLKSHPL